MVNTLLLYFDKAKAVFLPALPPGHAILEQNIILGGEN